MVKQNNTRIILLFAASALLVLVPLFMFAQTGGSGTESGTLDSLIGKAIEWARLIINLLLVVATLVFLWGIIKYISAGGDAAKVKEARSYILWGLIGLAIMASVWAIVWFINRSISGSGKQEQEIPSFELD
jgi:hypothetical protein